MRHEAKILGYDNKELALQAVSVANNAGMLLAEDIVKVRMWFPVFAENLDKFTQFCNDNNIKFELESSEDSVAPKRQNNQKFF